MTQSIQTQADYAIAQAHLKNAIGLPDDALAHLAVDLSRFWRMDGDLPTALLKYAVDSEGAAVLQEFHQLIKKAMQRNPRGWYNSSEIEANSNTADTSRKIFFQMVPTENAAFYYRLAEIYHTQRLEFPSNFEFMRWQKIDFLPFLDVIALSQEYHPQNYIPGDFPIDILSAMCELAGESPSIIVEIIFGSDLNHSFLRNMAITVMQMKGFADYVARYPQALRLALIHKDITRRVFAVETIRKCNIPVTIGYEQLIKCALSSAKADREAAWPLLESVEVACHAIMQRLTGGKVDERLYAAQFLHYVNPEQASPMLATALETEKSEKVRNAINNLINPTIIQSTTAPTYYELPPLPDVDGEAPVSDFLWQEFEELLDKDQQDFQRLLQEFLDKLKQHYIAIKNASSSGSLKDQYEFELCTDLIVGHLMQSGKKHRELASNIQQSKRQPAKAIKICEDAVTEVMNPSYWQARRDRTRQALQSGNFETCRSCKIHSFHGSQQQLIQRFLDKILMQPDLSLIQLLRLLIMLDFRDWKYLFHHASRSLTQYYRLHPENNLLTVGLAMEHLGFKDVIDQFVKMLLPLQDWISHTPFMCWEKDAIWPLFANDIDYLEQALTVKYKYDGYKTDRIRRALQIINTFPKPPAQLLPILWNMAFSGQAKERLMAQTTLDNLPDTRTNIINHLQDSDPQKRIIAAQWLARLQETSIIPQLISQLKTEKREPVRDAWMRSLERLGASVDQFLDRDNLIKEAETGLKKGIPNALAWFPFDRLPTLHWQDSGNIVAPQIIQWFILQTHKQKNVEPNPMLRRYLQLMQPSDREALGQFVLETWIAQDTKTKYSPEEAETKARQEAKLQWQSLQQYMLRQPQRTASYQQHTEESIYKLFLSNYLNSYEGSATADKGILAIAGVGCGVSAIPKIANYLKTHYGNRLAQCLALLTVLAWIEDNSAIQLLLAISNRFRTKKIQTEAANLVTQIADRNGWSRDELADLTIPTCGFTDRDQMTLDYGDRQFTAHLDDKLNLILTDSQGKTLKTLPEPRKDEDPELTKLAKKQLSDAKKQLKQVLTLQQERLYEAMCTQRQWLCRDWEAFLANHPIVSRHCQRLIWAELDSENRIHRTFRALGDGSLTDHTDREITLAPTASIVLAHSSHLTPEIRQSWQTQLDDYEIIPIFDQLTKPIYQLPPDRQNDLELNDFTGHMLEAFHLRGRATKLGYTRGEAQDGGWFYEYHKRFLGLGLIATIGFSGNGLPEENRPIALTQLSFSQIPTQTLESPYHYDSRIPLGEVPIVLLSEIYSDLRSIAALGTGFDPDWEKKVWY